MSKRYLNSCWLNRAHRRQAHFGNFVRALAWTNDTSLDGSESPAVSSRNGNVVSGGHRGRTSGN